MLSRTCLQEHLVFEMHANRHMESFDSFGTVFPEDARDALAVRHSGIPWPLQASDSILKRGVD